MALAGVPLAAPSANRFGKISPTTAQAVNQELGNKIDLILDGGPCDIGLESTVVSIEPNGDIHLLRPGMVSPSEIEKTLGTSVRRVAEASDSNQAQSSPGRLKSHYAPTKPLRILASSIMTMNVAQLADILNKLIPGVNRHFVRIGLLLMSGDPEMASMYLYSLTGATVTVRNLSKSGNLEEIAQKLFSELRFLDETNVHVILTEPCPSDKGLGFAITDRLQRASTI